MKNDFTTAYSMGWLKGWIEGCVIDGVNGADKATLHIQLVDEYIKQLLRQRDQSERLVRAAVENLTTPLEDGEKL